MQTPHTNDAQPAGAERGDPNGPGRELLRMGALLLPALLAVWMSPGFVSQDGPARLYNAYLLGKVLGGDGSLAQVFRVRFEPIPNWAGHLVTLVLLPLGAGTANRLVLTLSMAGFGAAVLWFRRALPVPAAQERNPGFHGALAAALSLSTVWLLGFSGFLITAALGLAALRFYARRIERFGFREVLILGAMLVLCWLGHLVAAAVTLAGLLLVASAAPVPRAAGGHARVRRILGVAAAALPLLPLVYRYLGLARSQAAFGVPVDLPRSAAAWYWHLREVDPLSLVRSRCLPFGGGDRLWAEALSPSLWVAVVLAIGLAAGLRRSRDRMGLARVWIVFSGLLLLAGVLGPDDPGRRHGSFLSPRLTLLGLVAAVPALRVPRGRAGSRIATAILIGAVFIQTGFIWDYAGLCRTRHAGLERARALLPCGNATVAAYPGPLPCKFRVDPRWHYDDLLGPDGRIVWNNYETGAYYFPVALRRPGEAVPADSCALLTRLCAREDPGRIEVWRHLLAGYGSRIDYLVVWTPDEVDSVQASWYEPMTPGGIPAVYRRREAAAR